MSKHFSIGDVVKLNSGGPNMTVIRHISSLTCIGVEVSWVVGLGLQQHVFPYECVTLVKAVGKSHDK